MEGIRTAESESRFDDLERLLQVAPVLKREPMALPGEKGFHENKFRIHLAGEATAIAKPEEGVLYGPWLVRCEVGAWRLARLLGWEDLVPPTVFRHLRVPDGDTALCSVQAACTNVVAPGISVTAFPSLDVVRAATFDFLMQQGDRHGDNWLGVRRDDGSLGPVLIDNGFALNHEWSPTLVSAFYDAAEGQDLPFEVLVAIKSFLADAVGSDLQATLPEGTAPGLIERAEHLSRIGHVPTRPHRI